MRLELFSHDLSNRHEITHAISSEFSDYYNDVGKFTVVLPMDEYNIGIVELDAVLYIVEQRLAYTVEEIQFDCDNSEITLNGYSLNNKLNRRVVAETASYCQRGNGCIQRYYCQPARASYTAGREKRLDRNRDGNRGVRG